MRVTRKCCIFFNHLRGENFGNAAGRNSEERTVTRMEDSGMKSHHKLLRNGRDRFWIRLGISEMGDIIIEN